MGIRTPNHALDQAQLYHWAISVFFLPCLFWLYKQPCADEVFYIPNLDWFLSYAICADLVFYVRHHRRNSRCDSYWFRQKERFATTWRLTFRRFPVERSNHACLLPVFRELFALWCGALTWCVVLALYCGYVPSFFFPPLLSAIFAESAHPAKTITQHHFS